MNFLGLELALHTYPAFPVLIKQNNPLTLLALIAARHAETTRVLALPTRSRAAAWIIWFTAFRAASSCGGRRARARRRGATTGALEGIGQAVPFLLGFGRGARACS